MKKENNANTSSFDTYIDFVKFTGKCLCQRLPGLRPATLLKKRLWYTYYLVNFVKFLRTPFLTRTPLVAASINDAIPSHNFKFRKKKKCSIVNKRLFLLKFLEL